MKNRPDDLSSEIQERVMPASIDIARHIVWLGELAAHESFAVGGKAASLSRLAARYPVPPGFALTTTVFELGMAGAGSGSEPGEMSLPMSLPVALRTAVANAYHELGRRCGADDPAVAVRSSAVDEDGADASFAGQHETFLNVVGEQAVVEAIGRCWQSFTAPHALAYRRQQGLPTVGVRVAVLVQQLVIADAAAVAFTADPVTDSRDAIVINANWGLGESIVGGTVTPDIYVVRRDDLSILRREIAQKRRMTVAVPEGTAEVDTPAFLCNVPALTDDQAVAIAGLALALDEEGTGLPVDIECAYGAGKLYLLQCRPITTLGHAQAAPSGPTRPDQTTQPADEAADDQPAAAAPSGAPIASGERIEPPSDFPVTWEHTDDARLRWTLDRVHWPDPIPPLVFAVAGDALAHGLSSAAMTYELPFAEVRIQRINTYRYQASVPVVCSPEEATVRQARSEASLRAAMGSLRRTWTNTWLPEVQDHLGYWDAFDLEGASIPELLAHLDQTLARVRRLWELHFLLASPMHGAIRAFGRLYRDLFGGSALRPYQLLQGSENRTILAGRALWYLSRLASGLPQVRAMLTRPSTETAATLEALEQSERGREFLAELRAYLDDFGQRGETLYLERPSWADDPTPVLEEIRGLLQRDDRDVVEELVASWDERDQLVQHARTRLAGYPAAVRDEFEFLLAAAQEAIVLTEDHNFWIDAHALQRVRRVFLEFGRRLAAQGALVAPEDVFLLTERELRESSANLEDRADWRALVAERQAEMTRFRTVRPPSELGTRPAAGRARVRHPGDDAALLRGHAASAGRARGVARLVPSLAEAGRLRPGDVLVTESLSSSWTPLFATAGAAVTESGGILSHAAVVAREYRLPTVLGAEGATSRIRDGQLVEVDGDQGLVYLLPDATHSPAAVTTEHPVNRGQDRS